MVRKKVFEGRVFKVFKSRKRLPNGRETLLDEIEHPGAALVIPFVENKVVFIRQYRGVIGKYIWELPAGTLSEGETPYACAKRELEEETGYAAKALKKIGEIYTTPGFCNEKIHIFKAECRRGPGVKLDDDEVIKTKHLAPVEIRRMFKNGKIKDSKTISALSFAGIL